ncbi:MAG: hypothetical protein KA793_05815 [Bacteroidales bacterium]|mgnify:CR=1 FL=1|nr:hypothetical protein [Bacteroidales bacterium]HNZ43938.1 (Fe-S)-binding protein [Bacteroidales bacterium]
MNENIIHLLPKLDCGACGFKTCAAFADSLASGLSAIDVCPYMQGTACACQSTVLKPESLGEKLNWKDHLKRDFDFILDIFPEEPGPRETILPFNPLMVREMNIVPGEILIGRPMGMSCGCPVTHCGTVMKSDALTGVIDWCVTGPLDPRRKGYKDIGFYVAHAYDGLVSDTKETPVIGKRYWFMPRRCMLQWRHSGLVNSVARHADGIYHVRIEGLYIG